MITEIEGPVLLAAALHAYRALWHGQVAIILGRPMEDADVQPLKAEQHRLACLLAGVPENDADPLPHFCFAAAWHVDDWLIDGKEVVCPACSPGAGRIAGSWYDVTSVLLDLPVVQEALRRLLGDNQAGE